MKLLARREWTSARSASNGSFEKNILGLVSHWPGDGISEYGSSKQYAIDKLLSFWRYHVNTRKWGDIGYNFAIDMAGRIWELRGWNNVGAHCASPSNPRANRRYYGVVFLVGKNQKITSEAAQAYQDLRAELLRRHPGATAQLGHGSVPGASTSCPGPYVKAMLGGSPTKPSPSKPSPSRPSPSKSVTTMAKEVIAGKHGNGHANRKKSLGVSDATYAKVRAEVNRLAGGGKPAKPSPAKTVSAMAKEVIAGKHGNGHANRQKSLGISASQYAKVRAEVNRLAGGGKSSAPTGKSVSQMATEVIAGKHGNGHANRRKSLGISASQYAKVRAEVNRRVG